MNEHSSTQPEPRVFAVARAANLDMSRIPRHVAIIMDGNGRWATDRGLHRLLGHHQGSLTIREIIEDARDLGIGVVTLYSFSTENWRRPIEEVSGLMSLIAETARMQLADMMKKNVRVVVSGRLHEIPDDVRDALLTGAEETRHNTGIIMNLAINYGGRAELVDAMRSLARRVADGSLQPEAIDEQTIAAEMYQPDLPDPDLMIRTANEKRLSNFLIWQTAYTEIVITPTLWPDFTTQTLIDCIAEYQSRTRKFGAVVEPA